MGLGNRHIPIVAHVIDRLMVGGMENGLVNLINNSPRDRYRHVIICLRNYSDFRGRIQRDDVDVYALEKRVGRDPIIYRKLWRLLRRLNPDIVHTRNLPAVDMILPAVLASVRCRVHGEHGKDVLEIDGRNRKYNLLRRAFVPWVDRYIAVSRDIEAWLQHAIGVPERKIVQIYNGVDGARFHPPPAGREPLPVAGFAPPDGMVIGTVGRMETVKDQLTLGHAFIHLLDLVPGSRRRLRLVLIGDGVLRGQVMDLLDRAGVANLAWVPGSRAEAAELLRGFDVFVLPSINEGISNTILEAMASGLPVVATDVGGNRELVLDGVTGKLVPPAQPLKMAEALASYVTAPGLPAAHGRAGRQRIEREFTMGTMVEAYLRTYDDVLSAKFGRVSAKAGEQPQ